MAHRANCQRLQLAQVSQNGRCPAREVRVRRRGRSSIAVSKRSRASFSASTTRTAPPDPLGGASVSSAAAPGVGGANVSAGGSPPSRMRAKVPAGHLQTLL